MELFSAEAESIQKRVEEWLGRQDMELEATFGGAAGVVDSVTFLTVAQRLRAKGFEPLQQQDTMTITTPDHMRLSLRTIGIIQQYCRDDDVASKPFTAVIKDRATAESQVDLDDYGVRVKVRREVPLARDDATLKKVLDSWPQQRKAFRILRRWSFEAEGLRVDMSIVRSTKKDKRGEFRWQRKFTDQDVAMAPPTYEIEVEVLRLAGDTAASATKRLIKGVGEVLRGIQKSSVLIRNSVKASVIGAYKELTGTTQFRGPSLRTLMMKNYSKEREKGVGNIRDGYNVTDKADGLRCLGFVDARGDLYLIDMGMNVYKTGLRRPELRLSLVDGEWVTKTKDEPPKPMNLFLVFDIFYAADKKDVHRFPFEPGAVAPVVKRPEGPAGEEGPAPAAAQPPENSRFFQLQAWTKAWNAGDGPKVTVQGVTVGTRLNVAMKDFKFAKAGDGIFQMAARVLGAARPYYTDGLIFTPNAAPLPSRPAATFNEQFKWKPSHDNTIDFYVEFAKEKGGSSDKITIGIKPGSGESVMYKTLRLYVGSRDENPRTAILQKKAAGMGEAAAAGNGKDTYRPVLFTPTEFPDPDAYICNLPLQRDVDTGEEYVATESGEPIQNKTIVEMAYEPLQPPGWRWRPLRVRMDKTEKLQKGVIIRTLNAATTAEDVWNSIYDPISTSMISTGADMPTTEELAAIGQEAGAGQRMITRRYFEREGPAENENLVAGLKKFHTRWIKERILYRAGLSGEGKQLVDLACGMAGDLHVWRRVGVRFVLGVDNAASNIMGTKDGAYKRYAKLVAEEGEAVEPMIFAIGDTSKTLVDGKAAGENQEDADLLRAVFGRVRPVGEVPVFVKETAEGRLRAKADCVACMFAIHYFFQEPAKLEGLLRNIADSLRVGGYFIGCCFDGQKVFDALRGTPKGGSIIGKEGGAELWRITKEYDEDEMPTGDEAFGLPVTVFFKTIGAEHREYLVPFGLLEDKMKRVGCELLDKKELGGVGLVNSTATFDVSYEMAEKQGQKYGMGEAAKQFSFFNRWFIFKRKREETIAEAIVAEAEAAAAAGVAATAVPNVAAAATVAPGTAAPPVGRAANARNRANAVAAAATALATGTAAPKNAAELAAAAAAAANAAGVANVPAAAPALGAAPDARTVPVAPGPAAAPGKTYKADQVFIFYTDAAASKDLLRIGDKGAGRWLAPSAPFQIEDPEDPKTVYPTTEHFIAAMRLKYGTNKPELGKELFSREGKVHQKFLNDRLMETNAGTRPLSEERDLELRKAELAAVKEESRLLSLRKYKVTFSEANWATQKDKMLEYALNQRWTKDARFRRAVEAARNAGKYLLYYTPGATTSNMGGVRSSKTDQIEGENRIGRIMMRLAGYPE